MGLLLLRKQEIRKLDVKDKRDVLPLHGVYLVMLRPIQHATLLVALSTINVKKNIINFFVHNLCFLMSRKRKESF